MWAFTSLPQRQIDPDDIAGVQALYAITGDSGSIAGTVRVGGQPAFGAHVVAVAGQGPVRGALTLPSGAYRIDALPPGSYTLYVEPLDGPHGAAFVDGCIRFGNMSGGGIYDGAALTTSFSTVFYGGNDTPVELTVDPGHVVLADFDLASDTPALNPVRVGPGAADGTFRRLAETPLEVTAGAMHWLAIGGANLDRVDGSALRILGPGISVDPSDIYRPEVSCGDDQLTTLIFPVQVAADARPGGRSIMVASGEEIAAFTGALRIRASDATPLPSSSPTPSATSTPVPCVGDCDGNDRITVDELVRGVNISLERTALATCADFDRDGNQRVTVDELVVGVGGLLAGCV
jgi:hypothetical protein